MGILIRIIFIALIFLIPWSVIYFIVSNINDYLFAKRQMNKTISFKNFQKFYDINPDPWDLQKLFVTYTIKKCGSFAPYSEEYYFRFNYLDLIQYKIFRKQIKKLETKTLESRRQQKNYDDYQKVLADIERNIKLVQKKNEEEMREQLAKIRAGEQS